MGGDRVDAQVPGGVPPPGGTMDHGDDGENWGRRRVVVTLSSGGPLGCTSEGGRQP